MREEKRSGKVYVMWAIGTALFKIGYTNRNVMDRLLEIDTHSPLHLLVIGSAPGNKVVEQSLHRVLRQYRHKGEWFSLPEEIFWGLCFWIKNRGGTLPDEIPAGIQYRLVVTAG